MKKWQKSFLAVSSLLIISAGCMSGCNGSQQTDTSTEPQSESSVATSSDVSEVSSKVSETSKLTESSAEESKAETNPALQEIKILNDFKKNIPSEQDLVYQEKRKAYNSEEVLTSEERAAKLYFVDAVIRDINDDGHYEMIVKYDGRGTDINGDIDSSGKLIYDIVTIKDGKAVSSGHYENEEGWYNHGARK